MRKTKTIEYVEIDIGAIKRCYADLQLYETCPDCGSELSHHTAGYYLIPNYEKISFYCETCNKKYYSTIAILGIVMVIERPEVLQLESA